MVVLHSVNNIPSLIPNLLARGLFLFPVHSITETGACTCKKGTDCTSKGKHPYLNVSWTSIATNSLEKFKALAKNRQINYAVATGKKSEITGKYLVVVDVDAKEHPILKRLPKETFRYKTGSGGFHYWFWSSQPIKNSVSLIANKVDIRGTGGYVIIPPSLHHTKNSYELMCEETQEIADLPDFIYEALKAVPIKDKSKQEVSEINKQKSSHVSKPKYDSVLLKTWLDKSVSEIRTFINQGNKIPVGIRNIVLHKLLSSDRAKGIITYEELLTKANTYLGCLEQQETFDEKELRHIVSSVMRYPVYNTSFENVNKNYCKWVGKNLGYDPELDKLEKIDSEFFSLVRTSDVKVISLSELASLRRRWYAEVHGLKDGFATYKQQLLAKKLSSLGIERKRTAKANVWCLDITAIENVLFSIKENCLNIKEGKNKMSAEENKQEESNSSSNNVEDSNFSPIGPTGEPLTFVEEREEIIETDRKYNPNAKRYTGSENTQEMISALVKHMTTLTPEQLSLYGQGTLLYDEERTRDFYSFLEVGDVIGVKTIIYKIVSKDDSEEKLICNKYDYSRRYKNEAKFQDAETEISIYQLDEALSLGACEILYRNDKPYGLDSDLSYKVKIKVYADNLGRTYVFRTGKEVKKIDPKEEANK